MKSIKLFVFIILLTPMLGFSSVKEIENFDLRSYQPQNYSLKDLVFEIRITNLTEQIKKSFPAIRINNEIYFKVFWIIPGKYDVEVHGFPKGFREKKSQLKALVINRLDMVIPQRLQPKLRSYKLKKHKNGKTVTINAKDESQTRGVNEMNLIFGKSGKLKSVKTMSPTGVQKSDMKYSIKSWSHNKWVMDEVKVSTLVGVQRTEIFKKISYSKVDGFGFPEKLSIKTKQSLVLPKNTKKNTSRTSDIVYNFSNYQVNTGQARKQIQSQHPKK